MKEWAVFDKVFPFVCANTKCKEKYSYPQFDSAALVRGFIFLTNDKFYFIGLTCPSCGKTTINKYSPTIADFKVQITSNFVHVAYFFADDLKNLTQGDSEDLYHVPSEYLEKSLKPDCQPWLEEKFICEINESDINKMMSYENKNNKKVFPRITSDKSVYCLTDHLLPFVREDIQQDLAIDTSLKYLLNDAMKSIAMDNYLDNWPAKTSITAEEHKDLALTPQRYKCLSRVEDYMPDFLDDYIEMRNDLDFELTYKLDLFDIHLKKIYYFPGYHESENRVLDKLEYEEAHGKLRINFRSESGSPEILSYDEILNRWDRNSSILFSFITNGVLTAYMPNGRPIKVGELTILSENSRNEDENEQELKKDQEPKIGGFISSVKKTKKEMPEASKSDIPVELYQTNLSSVTIHPEHMRLEHYIYLKSDVEDLEILYPWLKKKNTQVDEETEETLSGDARRRIASLKRKIKQHELAIDAAIKIGLWAADKGLILRKDVQKELGSINQTIPNSTMEIMWKALPDKKKWAGGKPPKKK